MEPLTNECVVNDLVHQINGRLEHPYLIKHEIVPEVDLPLLRWLVELIDCENSAERELALATYFAYQSLELHEQVQHSARRSIERQLLVLAGDFASAHFYQILAKFPAAYSARFGEAVQRVNAARCRMNDGQHVGLERWIEAEFGPVQCLAELLERDFITEQGWRVVTERAKKLKREQQEQLATFFERAVV